MSQIESIDLSYNIDDILFILVMIGLALFTFFIYKYTIPHVSKPVKIILTSLRTIALTFLLFVFFEPVLMLNFKNEVSPSALLFIDNSSSIAAKDSTNRSERIIEAVEYFSELMDSKDKIYTFGSSITPVKNDDLSQILFDEKSSDYSAIFDEVTENNSNVSSILIIGDGIITAGESPIYKAERLNYPVYTVGVGDQSKDSDLSIKKMDFNKYIYSEKTTILKASLLSNGISDQNVSVGLKEDNKLIESKNVEITSSGITQVEFEYAPASPGEKKLEISISKNLRESNLFNNNKTFYIDVLSNKKKIFIAAGAPSNDLSFVKNSLMKDKNLDVTSFTQINSNMFVERENFTNKLDSAEVIILIGFPGLNSPSELTARVFNTIEKKRIPYLFTFSSGIDLESLKQYEHLLPISISGVQDEFIPAQPHIIDKYNPLIKFNSPDWIFQWENLSPVNRMAVDLTIRPNTNVIANVASKSIVTNIPLIISRVVGNSKSIGLLADGFWKWKLQPNIENRLLFEGFWSNSIKWLTKRNDQKQFVIYTDKRLYSSGEQIYFTAQVYDETLTPINEAQVSVNVKNDNDEFLLNLNSVGDGIFSGILGLTSTGEYYYSAEAKINNYQVGFETGRFLLSQIDLEKINLEMKEDLLTSIADITNGNYEYISKYKDVIDAVFRNKNESTKIEYYSRSINIWSETWTLIFIIMLLGAEWLLRKKSGML